MAGLLLSMRFGEAVRKHRIATGYSQEKIAELAQLHPTYISMVERGVRNPTLDVAARLSKALGIRLSKLIEDTEAQ